MRIQVIEPHGFCAGVTNALRKAQSLLGSNSNTHQLNNSNTSIVYCLHELVHNELVVNDLKRRGMVFVESLDEVPEGATVLFSAHGVSPAVRAQAAARKLKVVDATCPFVEKVHKAAKEFASRGLKVVVIGNPDHAEVKGITGEVLDSVVYNPSTRNFSTSQLTLGVVSQTTMNADEVADIVAKLRGGYEVETMAEVCNATKVRQDAVKAFDGDALLVLGSVNSSNTRRLCEVAKCAKVFRAGTLDEVKAIDFSGVSVLGVTSGASTPENFFTDVIGYLQHQQGE